MLLLMNYCFGQRLEIIIIIIDYKRLLTFIDAKLNYNFSIF